MAGRQLSLVGSSKKAGLYNEGLYADNLIWRMTPLRDGQGRKESNTGMHY